MCSGGGGGEVGEQEVLSRRWRRWRRMCTGGGVGGGVEQEVEEVEVEEVCYMIERLSLTVFTTCN
jgi:hypothetical protein